MSFFKKIKTTKNQPKTSLTWNTIMFLVVVFFIIYLNKIQYN